MRVTCFVRARVTACSLFTVSGFLAPQLKAPGACEHTWWWDSENTVVVCARPRSLLFLLAAAAAGVLRGKAISCNTRFVSLSTRGLIFRLAGLNLFMGLAPAGPEQRAHTPMGCFHFCINKVETDMDGNRGLVYARLITSSTMTFALSPEFI